MIAKEQFHAYEDVRKSGITNMYSRIVQDLAGLTREEHAEIIKHYEAFCHQWPDVRDLEATK